jgi:hypothetical protein
MTELDKILLTSGLTIIGGCLVFVVQRFLLDPLNEQSRVLGRITFAVHCYGREYNSPLNPDHADQASQQRYWTVADRLREPGSSLAETSQGVRLYWIWPILRMAPRRKRIDEAIGLLTRMSNNMFAFNSENRTEQGRQNGADANVVTKVLGLRPWGRYVSAG